MMHTFVKFKPSKWPLDDPALNINKGQASLRTVTTDDAVLQAKLRIKSMSPKGLCLSDLIGPGWLI